jgi:YidC/Oxa1 family membrane protein insertase
MERRVLLAIFLAFLTLYLWQALVMPPPKPVEGDSPAAASTPTAPETPAPAPREPELLKAPESASNPVVGETAEREIRLENPDVVATFTNRGGRLKSWQFKRHRDSKGEPFELVVDDPTAGNMLPFSLRVDDAAATRTLNEALYAVHSAAPQGADSASRVSFEYRDAQGLRAIKEFQLDPTSYVMSLKAQVHQGDKELAPAIEWGPALGKEPSASGRTTMPPEGIVSIADSVQRIPAASVAEQPSRQGDFQFAGVEDHYFIAAALFPGSSTITFHPVTGSILPGTDTGRPLMNFVLQPGKQNEPLRFYVGPKDFDRLAAVDRSLVRAINFGMFAVLVVPLLRALNWVNGYVGNYGWSIILLTILINAAMFPLRHKSVVSMRKMQEIQPEAKAIQDRYKNVKATDPAKQKMNQELMALYRERGVNPASGCVPMLLTLPVLLAFYSLLSTAIELRGAPFIGWIHDLSRYDPYYVTPVLMGITQVWQQRITPQTGVDPAQQKMMMFMPIMFMAFFLWAPAGVALYWFISNLWGIGQQYLTTYLIGPPKVHPVRPPAERRVKKVGSGRTDSAAEK